MQNKSRKAGGPTDLLKNHEMTDWDQVDQFAQSLAKLLAHEPTASAVAKIVQASPAPLSMNSAGKVSLGLIGFLTLATGLYFEQWWWSLLGLLILGGIFLHAYFWYTILD
jgi:hypothetical protein